jgi:hypothetical protein
MSIEALMTEGFEQKVRKERKKNAIAEAVLPD